MRATVEAAKTEYQTLAEKYDRLVLFAGRSAIGSKSMVRALLCANDLAPHVAMALRRYHDAVEILAVFYQQVRSTREYDCGHRSNRCSGLTMAQHRLQ